MKSKMTNHIRLAKQGKAWGYKENEVEWMDARRAGWRLSTIALGFPKEANAMLTKRYKKHLFDAEYRKLVILNKHVRVK